MADGRKRARGRDRPGAGGSDDPRVFPPDAHGTRTDTPISLPASGLAEDILALADQGGLTARGASARAEPASAEPAPAAAAALGHNISFFAPARDEKQAAEATEHLATFFLAGEEYGVDVRSVQEIIRVGEVTQVPRAPVSIKGVINLRGRIIPVVDLRTKLGLGEVAPSRLARVVVVKLRDRLIGLLVDAASQVLKVPVSTIEAAPEEVVEIDAQTIRGVAKLEDRLIILLDLAKVLAQELREGGA
jgi:purine-binding chemotaxis protein CheW